MSVPTRSPDILQEDVPESGECVLVDQGCGRVLALNPAGAAVWDLIDGARNTVQIAGVLAEAASISTAKAEAQVAALVQRLRDEQFLTPEAE